MEKNKKIYKTRNWQEYNKALVKRGDISIWIDEEAIKQWTSREKSGERGASQIYTDRAIEISLMIRYIYGLPLRQTEGLLRGLSKMGGLNLKIPNYSTICRRGSKLNIELERPKKDIKNVVIDSTGLKVYGNGEWHYKKHKPSKRRVWKKLHLAVDSDTFDIVSMDLTENSVHDSEVLEELIENIDVKIDNVALDGAYDTKDNYNSLMKRDIKPVIPPRENAVTWKIKEHPRNLALERIKEVGQKEWKKESGYHIRSLAETSMFRFKTIFGEKLKSRLDKSQKVESVIKCKIINSMNRFGMPNSIEDIA